MLREMHTSGGPIANGIENIGQNEWKLIVDGVTVVDSFPGTRLDAWEHRALYVKAIAADATVAGVMSQPIDEIDPAYWLNGHIPPMSAREEFESYCKQFDDQVQATVGPIIRAAVVE